ncbi:hypothetical protein Nepgr_019417 [Nepenthes gracilis]|uniref:Uncharacterized protein n=1 Tax=Nepenthes gracilis TaxID=150966 RepID=A0AAD3SV99_NEPGR|nr:hypothetical protein Nepgr_019417 [Nepenthes gracilis]
MGRRPCCSEGGLNRGAWTAMEDKILTEYIKINGEGKWRSLPIKAGLKRCGKSCRLRWLNYLKPDTKRGNITQDEEDLIIRLHRLLGNRWSLIAGRLPGRTDNEIKNYWNTTISKRIQGHQSSTISRQKLINQSMGSLNQQEKSCVVRDEASRCAKVLVSHDIQEHDHRDDTKGMIKEPFMGKGKGEDPQWVGQGSSNGPFDLISDEYDPHCLLMDVEINEQFLSEVFKASFSAFFDPKSGTRGEDIRYDTDQLSPKISNQTLFSEDADWIASLLETEFDWS